MLEEVCVCMRACDWVCACVCVHVCANFTLLRQLVTISFPQQEVMVANYVTASGLACDRGGSWWLLLCVPVYLCVRGSVLVWCVYIALISQAPGGQRVYPKTSPFESANTSHLTPHISRLQIEDVLDGGRDTTENEREK